MTLMPRNKAPNNASQSAGQPRKATRARRRGQGQLKSCEGRRSGATYDSAPRVDRRPLLAHKVSRAISARARGSAGNRSSAYSGAYSATWAQPTTRHLMKNMYARAVVPLKINQADIGANLNAQ